MPPLKDWRLSPRSGGSCCFQLTRIDNGPGDPAPSLRGDYLRLITAPGSPDRHTRGPHARTSSRERALPHRSATASDKALLLQKCVHKTQPLPEQLRTTRCGTATPDSVGNLLLPRCRPPFFVPPDCRFAFGWGGVKDHARPAGIEKASVFRCPIEQFSRRIARKPVSMFQPTFFSATSRAERRSRRCCAMEKMP